MARRLVFICAILIGGASARAELLTDPTRPPNVTQAAADSLPAGGLVLQSILISPTRKIAIIGGQAVGVGDKVGEAQVVEIKDHEVVVREGKETRTLQMFSGIEKASSAPAPKDAQGSAKKGSKK